MKRWWLPLMCALLLCAWPHGARGEDPPADAAPETLSEEDRQVLQMIDLLEMLEMLDNLDDVAAMEDAQ